jgi:hypothetical protein
MTSFGAADRNAWIKDSGGHRADEFRKEIHSKLP